MDEDARQISMDGQPPPMSDAEFTSVVKKTGNSALFGDWYFRREGALSDSVEAGFDGRVSVDLSAYLDAFPQGEIETRIKTLKKSLPQARDVKTVRELITDTLTPRGWSSLVRPFSTMHIPAWSTYLYRVRPGLHGPEEVRTVGDIWTPPAGTSPGRVNRRGQPILYTSAQYPSVAYQESRAQIGEIVALSCFAIAESIDLLNLDDMDPHWNLSTGQQRKWRQLAQFYRWAFRDSGTDPDSPQYLVPQVLALDFNMIIPPLVGSAYRSVIINHSDAINVALNDEQAMNRLRLVATTVWQIGKPMSMHLASLVPKYPSLARDTPLVPGRFTWPSGPGVTQRSYRRRT